MKFVAAALAILLVAGAASAEVLDLTDATYEDAIKSNNVFVKYYAPWCGHCRRLAPTWDELGDAVADQNIKVAKVDCTKFQSICSQNNVRGYPTLKLHKLGSSDATDYRGGRSLDALQSWLGTQLSE